MEDEKLTLVCEHCQEEKPAIEFPIDKRSKTGHKSLCRTCLRDKRNNSKKSTQSPEQVISNYLENNHLEIYKALKIQSIAEDKTFMETLIESIKVKSEFMMIVKQFQEQEH